jgi:hypothetical protein
MSLLRGIVRTAVISGTASAVNGRVARRQAARFAEEDARTAALRQQAYAAQVRGTPPSVVAELAPSAGTASAPGPSSANDVIAQLKALADLKAQGILTDEEFEAQKARVLA